MRQQKMQDLSSDFDSESELATNKSSSNENEHSSSSQKVDSSSNSEAKRTIKTATKSESSKKEDSTTKSSINDSKSSENDSDSELKESNKSKHSCPSEKDSNSKSKSQPETIQIHENDGATNEINRLSPETTETTPPQTLEPHAADSLQKLLDVYKAQFTEMILQMKTPAYKPTIENRIQQELQRKQHLQKRVADLEKEINKLTENRKTLLTARMHELGIDSAPNVLIVAQESVRKHVELQETAMKLQKEIGTLEKQQNELILQRQQEIGATDLPPDGARDLILKEISTMLEQRNKLQDQVTQLEGDLEKQHQQSKDSPSVHEDGFKPPLPPPCINLRSRKVTKPDK